MHSSHCLDDVHALRRHINGGKSAFAKLLLLGTVAMMAQTARTAPPANTEFNTDADMGKIVKDPPPPGSEAADGGVAGEIDPNYVPILPFSEQQERRKTELEQIYKNDEIGLAIDSIEPEGGPITGETRVLVRGGPFEDMTLLYPRPKCKFGANDRIVEATYVKCHEKPLTMGDLEGKSKDKVGLALRLV